MMHHLTFEPERRPYLQSGELTYYHLSGCSMHEQKVSILGSIAARPIHPEWLDSFLPWLKNDKVVGVADEHTPEQIRGQQSIELGCAGILQGVCEGEEGYAGEFE